MSEMGLEHLVVPESKDVFKKANRRTLPKYQNINPAMMRYSKGHMNQLKESAPSSQSWEDLCNKIKRYWIVIQNIK